MNWKGERKLKRVVSGVLLILLLTSMLTLAFNIQPVKASGTIYIRADGSIDPPTAPILTVDNVTYILTGNIASDADGIIIERNNIVLDGAGYNIQGGTYPYKGIALAHRTNATIQNLEVKACYMGISLDSSSGCMISGSNITNNTYGIYLINSSNNTIAENYMMADSYGIMLYLSSSTVIASNIVLDAYQAITVDNFNNVVVNNVVSGNAFGISVDGSHNYLSTNNASNNDMGILLMTSDENIVGHNTVNFNTGDGMCLTNSKNNTLIENIALNNHDGIRLSQSSNNTLIGNVASNNCTINDEGITLEDSDNNTLTANTVELNWDGIYMPSSSNNIISGNNVKNNRFGIDLVWYSNNNSIYNNSFTNNTAQVSSYLCSNTWDNGYPSGGNYWSDYTDIDLYNGPNQDELGSDGIWDHPYVIDANNTDQYPLVNPWTTTEWTFAVITDLHIGRGYKELLYNSNYNGEDYYLTDRLQKVVKWISDNASVYNIKFVVVLGDITEDGTQVEMQKAKEILDGLGEIPYFPIIGNHDVQNGDSNFESEFDDNFFNTQCGKLNVAWENGRTNEPGARLQNYAFTYENKTFVVLDFVDRSWPYAQAIRYDSTMTWLHTQLQKGNPTFLFSHHPMIENTWVAFDDIGPIGNDITLAENSKGTKVLANFAGHIHGYYDPSKIFLEHSLHTKRDALSLLSEAEELISSPVFFNANGDYREEGFATPANIPVITTEAMMVGSNEASETKGVIRLAKITGDEVTTSEEGVFPSLNPYIESATTSLHLSGNTVDFKVYAFTKMFDVGFPIEYYLYVDGELRACQDSSAVEEVNFENQELTRGTHDVKLTVIGYAPDGSQVVESIKRTVIVGYLSVHLKCPADIVVTDPEGRSIGKNVNEIPNATYTETDLDGDGSVDKIVEILTPINGSYVFRLNGTDLGSYNLIAQLATSQEVVSFNGTEIPVWANVKHQYTIDWSYLSQGGEGVTVRVDVNGDGIFEYSFTSDSELTQSEFLYQVTPAGGGGGRMPYMD